MKIKQLFGVLALFALITPLFVASAATIRVGTEYSLDSSEVISDNFYVAGGDISIGGPVLGDLITAGGNVVVSNRVSGDLLIAGGSITILESVGGDVRIAGGSTLISKDVDGDLIVAGGSVQVLPGVVIGKDIIVTGGSLNMSGVVRGNVKFIGGAITINGQVNGNVKAEARDRVKIGDSALIKGDLIYSGRKEDVLEKSDRATIEGEVVYKKEGIFYQLHKTESDNNYVKNSAMAIVGIFAIFKLIAVLVAGLFGVIFFKKFSNSVVKHTVENPGKELLRGLVVFIVVPVAIILLFATLIGSFVAMVALLFYGVTVVTASVYAGIIFGAWLHKRLQNREDLVVNWKNAIGGIILLAIIAFVPVVGWIVGLIFFLFALGSISNIVYNRLWVGR